jgi:hypothetical protein
MIEQNQQEQNQIGQNSQDYLQNQLIQYLLFQQKI